jgi:hypothetical protein
VDLGVDEARAILAAYKLVKDASWPEMHPRMVQRSLQWSKAPLAELQAELTGYLDEASAPSCSVRVFWKLGPDYVFSGCNQHFASDAGAASPRDLMGLTDFDDRVPWQAQAAKFRYDDSEIVRSGVPQLDILERQTSSSGVVWVRVGKAPIRTGDGRSIGILGMYQLLDEKTATKLYIERSRKQGPSA